MPRRSWSTRDQRPTNTTTTVPPTPHQSDGPRHTSTTPAAIPSSTPIVRVSHAEKEDRSRKGLCWFCNEKWSPGHRCARRMLILIGDDDEPQPDDTMQHSPVMVDSSPITGDVSSILSLTGSNHPRSLRITGTINNMDVHTLIDSSSTHNFIHPHVAEKLSLPLHPISAFRVYVGNGDSLQCANYCPRTPVSLQGNTFLIDLYVLAVHGPDVVLGIQWLQQLGKISHDYSNMTMEFYGPSGVVTLQGESLAPRKISYNALVALAASAPPLEFYELISLSHIDSAIPTDTLQTETQATPAFPPDTPPSILDVLREHSRVF